MKLVDKIVRLNIRAATGMGKQSPIIIKPQTTRILEICLSKNLECTGYGIK